MELEDKSCEKCKEKFEDGNILIKTGDGFYHHSVRECVPPEIVLLSCSVSALEEGTLCIYYKKRFYDFKTILEKFKDTDISVRYVDNKEGIKIGQTLIEDLAFLDELDNSNKFSHQKT